MIAGGRASVCLDKPIDVDVRLATLTGFSGPGRHRADRARVTDGGRRQWRGGQPSEQARATPLMRPASERESGAK